MRLGYKRNCLMLYREIIAVCSKIHTKHINTLRWQNMELFDVKSGGTFSDHCVVHIVTTGGTYSDLCAVHIVTAVRYI